MRNYFNIFAAIFLTASIVLCVVIFTRIAQNPQNLDENNSKVLGGEAPAVVSEVATFESISSIPSTASQVETQPISSTVTYNSSNTENNSLFSSIFEWIDSGFKISATPEIYFDEDSQFLKDLNVSGSVNIENDVEIGGGLDVEGGATFRDNFTIDNDDVEINGIKYSWPDEQSAGSLVNDGSGELTWESVSAGVTTFLGLTDTPSTFAGSATYLARVNAAGTALEFIDASTVGGVSSVANSDGTLIISPTSGAVVASINLGNANTWTGAQTFNANTYFPSNGIWNTSGNVGIGTTGPVQKLDVVGNINLSESLYLDNVITLQNPGTSNIFVGANAGSGWASGDNLNTVVGAGAGIGGDGNLVLGYQSGEALTTGSWNVFSGYRAGASNTNARSNVYIGSEAGSNNDDDYNTFIGTSAGAYVTGASENTIIGYNAGIDMDSGTANVLLGASSGMGLNTGNENTLIGYGAGVDSGAISKSIALGTNSTATANNQFVMGSLDAEINDVYIGRGVTDSAPTGFTLNATGGLGPNIAAGNLTLAGGKATGNADGGDIIFSTSNVLASGSALQSLTEKMRLTDEGRLGIGTTGPAYSLDVAGVGRLWSLLTEAILLSASNASLLTAQVGHDGYTSFTGGIGTGGKDSITRGQRLTSTGNLVNIGSIQAGETLLTSGGTFAAKVDYTAGDGTSDTEIADVNGDGKNDIIASNSRSGDYDISVFINNGNGTFAAQVDYPAGVNPESLDTADLNGDGYIDIVTGNNRGDVGPPGSISVFINNQDGTFAAKVDYNTTDYSTDVTLGDFSGDGYADIAVANQGDGSLSVFNNNGDGTFGTRVDYTGMVGIWGIATGDMDGDGKIDLVASNVTTNVAHVLINNGDGTFAAKVDYGSGVDPYDLALGDVDGNGSLDIVTANVFDDDISVLLNDGDGTFAAKVDYPSGNGPYAIALGDVNGDGFSDIAVPNWYDDDVSILINNKNGTFAAKVDYTTGAFPYGISIGDLNGDGKGDLAVANYGNMGVLGDSISVLMNQSSPILHAQASTGNVGIGVTNASFKLEVAGHIGPSANDTYDLGSDSKRFRDLYLGGDTLHIGTSTADEYAIGYDTAKNFLGFNVNGSGNSEIVFDSTGSLGIGTTAPSYKLSVIGSNGNLLVLEDATSSDQYQAKIGSSGLFNYSLGRSPTTGYFQFYGNQSGATGYIFSGANGERMRIDTSGNVGIGTTNPAYLLDVASFGRIKSLLTDSLILSASNASLLTAQVGFDGYTLFTGGIGTGGLGRDSLTGAQRLTSTGNLTNIGSIQAGETHITKAGTFASKVDYATGTNPYSVRIGDVNGDGKADLVAPNYGSDTVSVYMNNGDGTFAAKVDYATGDGPRNVALGDLNGDGISDLATTNRDTNTVSVLINNGDGTFATKIDYVAGTNVLSIVIGDVNGDGKADMAVSNFGSQSISVFINNGDGTFATKVDYAMGVVPYSLAIGDVNGDGKADLASSNQFAATISVLMNNGDGTFAAKVDYAIVTGMDLVIGDIDGDGIADIAGVGGADVLSVYINDGDGTFAAKVDYTTGSVPRSVAIGDLNGDGKADLIVGNIFGDSVSVFINNGDGTFAAKVDYGTGGEPEEVAIGDVNGDGKADFVSANVDVNAISVFINQASTVLFAQASTGNVGIGTTAPESKLAIANLGTGTGTTLVIDAVGNVYRDSSSERYKMDIEPLETDFAQVLNLEPKTYKFKESGILSIGYIAEEVEALGGLSDLLIYDANGEVDGFKYDRLPIYTLEIVKDLDARVRAIEDHLGILEGRVAGVSDSDSDGVSDVSSESDYDGIIVVDGDGDVTIENSMRVKGLLRASKVNIDTRSEAIGKIVIPAGETVAMVGSSTMTSESLIFITADEPVVVSAKKTEYDHFEIELDQPHEFDVTVNWVIIN